MNKDNFRQIHTGLYSKVAKEIIDSVIGSLSDGWGENNPANEKWWKFVECKQASNGEVLIEVSTESYEYKAHPTLRYCSKYTYNGFYHMSESDVKQKFAGWIKKTAKMEMKDENVVNWWKRDSEFKLYYLSYDENVTVADAYFVYEHLLGRANAGKYCVTTVTKVVGMQLSEEEAKANEEKQRQITEKLDHRDLLLKQLAEKKAEEIKKIEEQYDKDRADIVNQYQKWIDDIREA